MTQLTDTRAGHYVDGRHRYGLMFSAQAAARAAFLAEEYGRPVLVHTRAYHGATAVLNNDLSPDWQHMGARK